MNRKHYIIWLLALAITAITFFGSCKKEPGEDPVYPSENHVSFNGNTELAYNEVYNPTFTILTITSEEDWTIEITSIVPENGVQWLYCSPLTGSGNRMVSVSNDSQPNFGFDRTAMITVIFETSEENIVISQRGFNTPPEDIPEWTELPEVDIKDNYFFITHFCELNGETVRNYSMLYDASMFTSYWVAYPLHQSYLGDVSRTDRWAFDPSIPRYLQLDYSSAGFGNQTWDRGHQIASADRNASAEMNSQTFYYTNITPQRWQLNQVKWANLENFLRGKVSQITDTVWVVTGAVFSDLTSGEEEDILTLTNANNPGIDIPVPNFYYKVALWYKKYGQQEPYYTAIGFWMRNEDTTGSITRNDAYTVREIQEKTGFDFFANLSPDIQNSVENNVNLQDWF